jgi:hypothetical protein
MVTRMSNKQKDHPTQYNNKGAKFVTALTVLKSTKKKKRKKQSWAKPAYKSSTEKI